jgi:hypothetical protein
LDQASSPRLAVALCAAVASCLTLPATATEPPVIAAQEVAAVDAADTSNAGMRAAVDPATGRVRPVTAEEAKALNALAAASAKRSAARAPRSFTTPSGAIGMELDSSHLVYSVATVGEDGKIQMECVTGEDLAHDAVHGHTHAGKIAGGTNDETK